MKVFMSWSGLRSKATAELLANWAKCVIQATQPWISTSGIDRGAVWFSTINDELKDTSVGIVCLTHENKNKPWILFESGALAKGLVNSRVCTFLVDLKPSDLESPLAQFNHTTPDREGLWNLARTLNNSVATPLEARILEQVFDTNWPRFEEEFAQLLRGYPQNVEPEVRSNDSILMEILESSRGMNQRMRVIEDKMKGELNGRGPISALHGNVRNVFSGGGTEFTKGTSLSEGMAIAHNMYLGGAAQDDVMDKLVSVGFGKKAAKEILEILVDILKKTHAPDVDVAPPPDLFGCAASA